uniref:Ovule protein n=1 Tax=Syphacia muris TaxID=451379 RepID=A0A0N5AW25_9BILA
MFEWLYEKSKTEGASEESGLFEYNRSITHTTKSTADDIAESSSSSIQCFFNGQPKSSTPKPSSRRNNYSNGIEYPAQRADFLISH